MRITVKQLKELIQESVEEVMSELNEEAPGDDLNPEDYKELEDYIKKHPESMRGSSAARQETRAEAQRRADLLRRASAAANRDLDRHRGTARQVPVTPPQPAAGVRRSTPTDAASRRQVDMNFASSGMQRATGNVSRGLPSSDELGLLGRRGQGGVTTQPVPPGTPGVSPDSLGRSRPVPQQAGPGSGNVRGAAEYAAAQAAARGRTVNMPAMDVRPRSQTVNMPAMNVRPRSQTVNMPAMNVRPARSASQPQTQAGEPIERPITHPLSSQELREHVVNEIVKQLEKISKK